MAAFLLCLSQLLTSGELEDPRYVKASSKKLKPDKEWIIPLFIIKLNSLSYCNSRYLYIIFYKIMKYINNIIDFIYFKSFLNNFKYIILNVVFSK